MKIYLFSFFLCAIITGHAQNVGIGTTTPNNTAALDINATNKGLLIPRLSTAQRKAISNPAMGLLVFDLDKGSLMFFDGVSWKALSFSDDNNTGPQIRASSQPSTNANLGSKVAISGNYAIIGAMNYRGSGLINMGEAYIFNKTGNGWKQVARLAANDSAQGDNFGGAVAISGDYAVVGSCTKKVNQNDGQGKVYIYHRLGNTWILDTSLVRVSGKVYDYFGWSVAVSSFTTGAPAIAIGIPNADLTSGDDDRGAVWCYRKIGSTWTFVQNLAPSDLNNSDYYGRTVTIDTDYVAVAAPSQDIFGLPDAGAVYIYAFGGGVWNFQQKLTGGARNAQFGYALGLSSNKLVVGAPFASPFTNSSAAVYPYLRTGANWAQMSAIFIYDNDETSQANTTFGSAVSISGTTLLIGASSGSYFPLGSTSGLGSRHGSAYIYKNLSGTTFSRINMIESEFAGPSDFFGESVSISGNKFVIANPRAIVNGITGAGNVYFGDQSD